MSRVSCEGKARRKREGVKVKEAVAGRVVVVVVVGHPDAKKKKDPNFKRSSSSGLLHDD